jgi:Mor family transcriptional regulator
MSDILTPAEIEQELARRLPEFTAAQVEKLTRAFVDLAAGKYVTGKRWVHTWRNATIRSLFNGLNARELARRFDLTPRQVRRLMER